MLALSEVKVVGWVAQGLYRVRGLVAASLPSEVASTLDRMLLEFRTQRVSSSSQKDSKVGTQRKEWPACPDLFRRCCFRRVDSPWRWASETTS